MRRGSESGVLALGLHEARGGDHALVDTEVIDRVPRVGLALVVSGYDVGRCGEEVDLAGGEGLDFVHCDVEDVQLHVEERVEERVDELRAQDHELGELRLHRVVPVLVVSRRLFEILLELKDRPCC